MKYKDYIGYSKPYILVHNTGLGVPESPYKEHDIVYETDNYEDAINKAKELKISTNTPEEISSNWCNNTYHININTSSPKGKDLLKKFEAEFRNKLKELNKNRQNKLEPLK